MESADVIRIMDAAVIARGRALKSIRSDNGPEFIALVVQEWIERRGFKTLYIAPAVRGRTPIAKASSCRFRDEFLNRESFAAVLEAKVLGKEYRPDYHHHRPHSSLDYQTPVEFAQRSRKAASTTLRQPQGCALPIDHITLNPNPENHPKLS